MGVKLEDTFKAAFYKASVQRTRERARFLTRLGIDPAKEGIDLDRLNREEQEFAAKNPVYNRVSAAVPIRSSRTGQTGQAGSNAYGQRTKLG